MTLPASISDEVRQGGDSDAVIVVSGLTKRYGGIEAVRGISFAVARGETFGFLGPNGAGKTTTIKILCTLANATSGSASVAGYDSATQRDSVRRNIGLVFQDPTLDTYLTAIQNLRFHAELYRVPNAALGHYMDEAENCDRIAIIDNGKRWPGRSG